MINMTCFDILTAMSRVKTFWNCNMKIFEINPGDMHNPANTTTCVEILSLVFKKYWWYMYLCAPMYHIIIPGRDVLAPSGLFKPMTWQQIPASCKQYILTTYSLIFLFSMFRCSERHYDPAKFNNRGESIIVDAVVVTVMYIPVV